MNYYYYNDVKYNKRRNYPVIFIIVKRLYYLFALLKLLKEYNYIGKSLDPSEYIIENKSMRNI